tara:strand:+ start:18177 stop:18740 length:564 start_codon:yes stop_codon:yes gene_type:complete
MINLESPKVNNEWLRKSTPLQQFLPNIGLSEEQSVDTFQLISDSYELNFILRDKAEPLMASKIILSDTQTSYIKDCAPAATDPITITSTRDRSSNSPVISKVMSNIHFRQDLKIAFDVFYGLMLLWTKSTRSSDSVISDYLEGWNRDYQTLIKKEGVHDQEIHELIVHGVSGVLFNLKQHKRSYFNF